MFHALFGLVLALALISVGCTSNPGSKVATAPSFGPVVLDSSEIFEIFSPTNDQHYRIRVQVPASYATDPSKHYPIIIKLDGHWDFLLAASAYNGIYFDGQMPETVIIGIDWGDIEGDVHAIRSRDLLPQATGRYPNSGRASTFVKVIAEEIMPELEKRYRLDGQRFLLGGSWSGVFATYALFENPAAFDGAIAIAPSYGDGADVLLQQIEAASRSQALKDKRFYIGIGSWDPVAPDVLNYAKALTEANVPGLKFKLDYLEGFGHSGMNIPGYAGGYQHMFSRPRLSLTVDQLRAVAGVYRMENSDDQIIVSEQDQELVVELPGGYMQHLWAQSETDFYHPGVFYNLSFEGKTASVETFFGKSQYSRVNP